VRSRGSDIEALLNRNLKADFESKYWAGLLDAQGKATGKRMMMMTRVLGCDDGVVCLRAGCLGGLPWSDALGVCLCVVGAGDYY
jgi:hypothetical protein